MWEYCIATAIETAKQTDFTISYDDGRTKKPRASSRLDVMKQLGQDGWELVTVREVATGMLELYFKRKQ